MRRNSALAVDTSAAKHELAYDLDASPRSSLYSETKSIKSTIKSSNVPPTQVTPTVPPKHAPSIRLLFSLLTSREVLFLLLPAVLLSMIAGGIAPFMTYVIGQSFSAFARFPQTSPAPDSAKKALLHDVGIAALELVGLAIGSFALSSMTSWLWIWIGERNVLRLRKRIYSGIVGMEMEWFDLKLGGGEPGNPNGNLESPTADQGDGPIGAGGLMAKFAKETDDVRTATSLASGMLIQYLTTCLTCLILAFTRSWSLTLVILSAVPALTLIQGFSQRFAGPLLGRERTQTASAATLIERSIASIATVKAFNAQSYETKRLSVLLTSLTSTATKLNAVWGLTSCMAQFVMMAMFVQGFWFGSKLVRDGKIDAGDVMSVFWACLIATSNLQMCIPQFITLAKGKFSMVSLLNLVDEPLQRPSQSPAGFATSPHTLPLPTTPVTPSTHSLYSTKRKLSVHAPIALRKIRPSRCTGELSLHNVTFAYPSRPTVFALQNVSIYLPANETTFIVGQSGSGKSTIGQLLLGMYKLDGEGCGVVTIDDRDIRYLDDQWIRSAVGSVGQSAGVVVIDGLSLWGNLVLGFHPADSPTRQQVDEACRLALLNEFVRDLPDGYDTALGSGDSSSGGAGLSGGQKQRLAIARARLRDPPILILDEATSALDPTTRILVFEAIKRWRKNKTTIVITHDLSQITRDDFVYVLKDGKVVEQGYRCDLEQAASSSDSDGGEFRRMMDMQNLTGGFLPERELVNEKERVSLLLEQSEEGHDLGADDEKRVAEQDGDAENSAMMLRPITIGNWMFDVVADLTRASIMVAGAGNQQAGKRNTVSDKSFPSAVVASREPARTSRFFPSSPQADLGMGIRPRRPLSVHIAPGTTAPSAPFPPLPAYTVSTRRFSLQFTPTSPTFNINNDLYVRDDTIANEDEGWEREFEKEKRVVEKSGVNAVGVRGSRATRRRWDDGKALPLVDVRVDPRIASSSSVDKHANDNGAPPRFWATVREVSPTIPNKPILFLGLFTCLLSGSMTPIFSFLLSRLLFETSTGAHNAATINRYGGIVLGVAALDGVLMGLKFWLMEGVGAWWVKKVRLGAFTKVLGMDKKWFDKVGSAEENNEEEGQEQDKDSKTTMTSENNSPARLVQTLIKDSDDAHSLISVVFGQCLVVLAMLSVGLIWALARGWQLTFVGFAIAPVFIIVMALQTRFVGSCELRNKRARESIARSFYETISNIRSIRSMSYEPVFQKRFDDAAENALNIGLRGAFVEGCTYGVASGLIYLAEALLFYVGAVLIAKGIYDYLRMVEVLNLVVFTVTIGSQLMAFTQKIAKSVQATHDLQKLLNLPIETDESKGGHKPYALKGPITFANVNFAYPERPGVPVLKGLSFSISPGEHVAIVGPSGSGKSTVALLLQRLYEPQSGRITIGTHSLDSIEVRHLRDHVAVVSQQPNLFDASVSDNIRYGRERMGEVEVINAAIKARVDDFVQTLPNGYETHLGENASLVSGGQAQRIQIARALARRDGDVLILDECTSALDGANQGAVFESLLGEDMREQGKTVVVVTHKMDVMKMCDRIVLLQDGCVVEQGRFDELVENRGVFATLARGGEWMG